MIRSDTISHAHPAHRRPSSGAASGCLSGSALASADIGTRTTGPYHQAARVFRNSGISGSGGRWSFVARFSRRQHLVNFLETAAKRRLRHRYGLECASAYANATLGRRPGASIPRAAVGYAQAQVRSNRQGGHQAQGGNRHIASHDFLTLIHSSTTRNGRRLASGSGSSVSFRISQVSSIGPRSWQTQ